MVTRSQTRRAQHAEEPQSLAEPVAAPIIQFKEFVNAFSAPIDEDKDYISQLPSETLDQVLSYLILDHDPDRGIKVDAEQMKSYGFKDQTHALLNLSAMSKHFMTHVESFSRRHLTNHKEIYRFKTTAELQEAKGPTRRSPRFAGKPHIDSRSYRIELVTALQTGCFSCHRLTAHRATMASGIACHQYCEDRTFSSNTITLSNALRTFDLRDYMLIKSRKPGPRAKHTELPVIAFGTVRTGLGYGLGMCVSYRFYERDVAMIAALVHGDIDAHMEKKRNAKVERTDRKLRQLHIDLKIRLHTDRLAKAESDEDREVHQKRLRRMQDPGWDGDWRSGIESHEGYGRYYDIHDRICAIVPCEDAEYERRNRYNPYYW